MSAFTFNGISIGYPSGCVLSYMGATEPEGWLFCDGVQRTNGQDGRYNNLIAAKIGIGTINANYTPPSLIDNFLRGADTATNVGFDTTNKLIGGGRNTTTLIADNLPPHNHDLTFGASHNHDVVDKGHSHGATTVDEYVYYYKPGWNNKQKTFMGDSIHGTAYDKTGFITELTGSNANISINATTCGLTLNNNGKGTSFDTIPRHTIIYYIIRI